MRLSVGVGLCPKKRAATLLAQVLRRAPNHPDLSASV